MANDGDEPEVRFEVALEQLERIVESLQRGEPELSKALAKYEAGLALLGRCHGLLERAERSVALLAGLDEDGEPITAPFDAAATLQAESQSEPKPKPKPKPAAPSRRRRARPAAEAEPEAEAEPDRLEPPF